MKIIVASTNPVKIQVAQKAFEKIFPGAPLDIVGVKSESGVPDQPINLETREGAYNRLDYISANYPDADYYISQEGGLHTDGEKMFNRAWIVVKDSKGNVGESSTASFEIPKKVAETVRSGSELSAASDAFWGTTNLGQHKGAMHMVTRGLVDRAEYYEQSAIIAICQTLDKDWYK
jgi:inosine/xanthosine triphosphatase